MRVSDIMTRNPVTVRLDASLEEGVATMLKARVSGLPVVDAQGVVVGMITEGDLLRRAELGTAPHPAGWLSSFLGPGHCARDYVRTHGQTVRDVMAREVIFVSPQAPLSEVVALMEAQQIKRLPVLQQGRLVGIVSRADVLRALVQLLLERKVIHLSDTELHEQHLTKPTRRADAASGLPASG